MPFLQSNFFKAVGILPTLKPGFVVVLFREYHPCVAIMFLSFKIEVLFIVMALSICPSQHTEKTRALKVPLGPIPSHLIDISAYVSVNLDIPFQ